MENIENFDPSQIKKIDEDGNAVPVAEEKQEEAVEEKQEETQEETQEESTSEETTEEVADENVEEPQADAGEESTEEQPETEENAVENKEETTEDEPQEQSELFETLDGIAKTLSNGKAENLEELFEDYKSLRESENVFKDDFIKNAVAYYNENGTLNPYLEATAVNFTEMGDEQVMRYNLKKNNPTLSDRAIERLYQRDVINKYSLDEDKFEEDEVELGKELLKADADKLRNTFVDEQKKFIEPVVSETKEKAENQKIERSEWESTVKTNKTTKDVLDNKRILISFKDETFSYEVDNPQELQEMTIDNNKFFNLFSDGQGNVDFDKWYRVLTYAADPETYEQSLISHGIGLGQEKVVKDLKNPSKVTKGQKSSGRQPDNPIEGLMNAIAKGSSEVKIIR